MRRSNRYLAATPVAGLAAALLLAACGSSSSSTGTTSTTAAPAASTSATVVKAVSSPSLGGTILVDSSGMTLYHLSGESGGHFICSSSACTAIWHPLTVSAGTKPTGAASLAVVTRPDGTQQVTYLGTPLYTFVQDASPGEAKGQGIKDVGTWTVVTVNRTIGSSTSTSTSTSTTSKYGY